MRGHRAWLTAACCAGATVPWGAGRSGFAGGGGTRGGATAGGGAFATGGSGDGWAAGDSAALGVSAAGVGGGKVTSTSATAGGIFGGSSVRFSQAKAASSSAPIASHAATKGEKRRCVASRAATTRPLMPVQFALVCVPASARSTSMARPNCTST